MASISFDSSTGWWSVRYFAGAERGRVKKSLCRHPGPWSKARPPKKPPPAVKELAVPFEEAERRARIGEVSPARETPLAGHVAAYLERAGLHHRPNTRKNVENACGKFLAYCAGRKVATLQAVTYSVCRDWIAHRLGEGALRSTVSTERSNLMPIWSEALRDRLVSENPWLAARMPGKRRQDPPTAWTASEVARLVAVLDGWLRDLVLLGVNTGIRIGAMLALRWPQVDWEAGLVRVRAADSKSGRAYEVPMTPTTRAVLEARHAAATDRKGPIFPNPGTGRPYRDRTTFARIKRAAARAGIPDHGDYNHILRRTFATIALNSGVPLHVVSKCLDHANLAQTERAYAHLLVDRIKKGMEGFDVHW